MIIYLMSLMRSSCIGQRNKQENGPARCARAGSFPKAYSKRGCRYRNRDRDRIRDHLRIPAESAVRVRCGSLFCCPRRRIRPIHPPQSAGFRILQRQGPPEREDGQPRHNFYENGLTSGKAGRILCPRC